ncbi:hypothetical protein TVAG_072390 [Trichomonas vaginalis G3]|uniref:Uncharacterized protein n=1 Tax=Trichomonas vaginalis (strain ATCC PRA-98 / G3) TaxID=412133 RepID=A2EUC3_TRIV3|nr:hypothetical protein TVAGG3_0372560 [Trichomonas vaginalis G3]EAY03747.1 hypothetical protein TVAG_072390 [Trichomonas vaginalis G3]KAI5532703.1 hypothetical protein TVAGG3_0372560 [Trichomonas vaginalis G3]|eukprot:XP_001315970.1 hypothetical protein [Trichomonas vaginalis G3]
MLQVIKGGHRDVATYKNVKFTTSVQAISTKYLSIVWNVKNNDVDPHYIYLTAFADIQIAENDRADVYRYPNNSRTDSRGITMKDPRTNNTLTLVVRDGYNVENVDAYWFGLWESLVYHEWDSTNITEFKEQDSFRLKRNFKENIKLCNLHLSLYVMHIFTI